MHARDAADLSTNIRCLPSQQVFTDDTDYGDDDTPWKRVFGKCCGSSGNEDREAISKSISHVCYPRESHLDEIEIKRNGTLEGASLQLEAGHGAPINPTPLFPILAVPSVIQWLTDNTS